MLNIMVREQDGNSYRDMRLGMENVEIERKFLIKYLPENINSYKKLIIEQGYLSVNPVVRVRRQDDEYYLTYKGKGLMLREEYNLPLTKESYNHLIEKADGNIIRKTRYIIPIDKSSLKIELDVFDKPFEGMILAEVEFETQKEADAFVMPEWFDKDVTEDRNYQNSTLSMKKL